MSKLGLELGESQKNVAQFVGKITGT